MSDLAGFLKTQLAKIAATSLREKIPYKTQVSWVWRLYHPKIQKSLWKNNRREDRVVQSWVKITHGLNSAKFEFKMWKPQTQLDVPEGFSKIQLVGQRYRDKTT